MKKIVFSCFLLIALLLFSGCSKEKEDLSNVVEEKTQTKEVAFKKDLIKIVENFNCEIPLTDIKEFAPIGLYFITIDGDVYSWSVKIFSSNGTNCMKIDSNIKFDRFLRGSIIGTDGKLYGIYDGEIKKDRGDTTTGYSEVFAKFKNTFVFGLQDMNTWYSRIDDNKLYIYMYGRLDKVLVIDISFPNDNEKIVSVGDGFIKTNYSYYEYAMTNREDVEKYADIQPEYGLVRMKLISDNYEYIKLYSGGLIILNDDNSTLYSDYYYFGG